MLKIKINLLNFTKMIINIIVKYYGIFNLLILNINLLLIFKFELLLYHFFKIRENLFIVFFFKSMAKLKDKIIQ